MRVASLAVAATVLGCSNDVEPAPATEPPPPITAKELVDPDAVREADENPSPFISHLDIPVDPARLDTVRFTIRPRPGALAQPLSATYAASLLAAATGAQVRLPVFGLYADHENVVEITLTGPEGIQTFEARIVTGTFDDPRGPLDDIAVTTPARPGMAPDFSYFLMTTLRAQGPVIADIDGYVRWAALELGEQFPLMFDGSRFVAVSGEALIFTELDGTVREVTFSAPGLERVSPHRHMTRGPRGFLVGVNADKEGELRLETLLLEIAEDGTVLEEWDFEAILESHLRAAGDNPSTWVRRGEEWFVMNSILYDPTDDSLLVSSRENFVIKIDYATKAIRWVFGDDTKHWHVNFPSLRPLALTTQGTPPIGQHALSIVDGELLLFNNGMPSIRQPDGAPVGLRLATSPLARYAIDASTRSAELTWTYDAGIFSNFCSSVERAGEHYLATYSVVDLTDDFLARAILQGVNEAGELLFELEVPVGPPGICRPFSSQVAALDDLRFE